MIRIYAILLYLSFSLSAEAQQPFARDFWLNESNTPVKVNAMQQDQAGYIWLGTDAGLYKFNGRNFFLVPDSVQQAITAISVKDGQIWVAYSNGSLGEVKNNTLQAVHIRNMPASNTIRDIYKVGDLLLLATEQGLYGLMNDVAVHINNSNGLSDNFTYSIQVKKDQVFVGTDKGLNIISVASKPLKIVAFISDQHSGLPDNIVRVIKPSASDNSFWVGTEQGGIVKLDSVAGGQKLVHNTELWKWGQVNDILPMPGNKAWVATEQGFLVKALERNDSIIIISILNLGKSIKKVLLDRTGNIWCATSQGITMISEEYASYLKIGAPYALNTLSAMLCDKDMLWFAENNDLYRVSLKDTLHQPIHIFTAGSAITTLFADTGFGVWVGTFGNGLYFLKGSKASHVDNIDGPDDGNILDIASVQGHLWVASLNGVAETQITDRVNGKLELVKHHNKQAGLGSDYIYQLYPDCKGRLWMATDGGGICMYDGQYHRWDSTDGIDSKVVYTITEDAKGNIWAGTLEKGLYFFNGKRWQNIRRKQGLQDINISSVASNATGQVIIVNQKGIDEWCPASRQFRHFNRRMFVDIDSVSKILNCEAKDNEGNVYIPLERGFVVFKNQVSTYDIRPGILITGISLYLNPVSPTRHTFDYDENNIKISFDGINYANPESLHYRYQLKGYGDTWIYTDDESVTFPYLQPGKYTFHVQVSLNTAFASVQEATYSFTIATPFWKQLWFIIILLLIAILMAYVIILIREKRLKDISHLQRERLVFEYEHLKSQVNPHFLFNSLNTLANLIEEDQESAVDYTTQLSDLYRHMIAHRNKDLISLAEELEILNTYMFIQRSRFGDALRLDMNIPVHLLHSKKIIPLALQIVAENAIKHNIVSASIPLVIQISANDDEIVIRNVLQPKLSKEKGAGLGLINISKRYTLLTRKEATYGVYNNEFIVKLPLL